MNFMLLNVPEEEVKRKVATETDEEDFPAPLLHT